MPISTGTSLLSGNFIAISEATIVIVPNATPGTHLAESRVVFNNPLLILASDSNVKQ